MAMISLKQVEKNTTNKAVTVKILRSWLPTDAQKKPVAIEAIVMDMQVLLIFQIGIVYYIIMLWLYLCYRIIYCNLYVVTQMFWYRVRKYQCMSREHLLLTSRRIWLKVILLWLITSQLMTIHRISIKKLGLTILSK